MPGIAGLIGARPAIENGHLVETMLAALQHQSFYKGGTFSDPALGVFAGWSAHDNSFAASQAFYNEQRDIALLFSGECFAGVETKSRLRSNGHAFSGSGGDYLVHLYEDEGERFFEKLNGQFSGLLIDGRQGKIHLFNDRYGMERIYWCETSETFYFASEAKALLRILPHLRRFDTEGVAQFLGVGCTFGGRTLFDGLRLLPGGSLWTFADSRCQRKTYFSPAKWEQLPDLTPSDYEAKFEATFRRILPSYVEAESRIGISLTAGLDTRMIMACLPTIDPKPVCYTYSGQTMDTLDARLAARVAAACGLEHKILRISPDFFADFPAWADRTVYATDGCFGVLGAHEIYLSHQARQLSPVRLTGVFGGEILRAVSTFKPLGLSPDLIHLEMLQSVNAVVERLRDGNEHPVTFAAFKEIPQNLFGTIMACRSQLRFRSPYLDNELIAMAYQAPSNLRHSCDSAIRFVRQGSRALGSIPTDMGYLGVESGLPAFFKRVAARLTFKLDYVNNEGLPHALSALDPAVRRLAAGARLLGKHKYLHYRNWLRRDLAPYVNSVLNDVQTGQNPFWNADFLKRLTAEHLSGRKNYVQEINAVLTLEATERLLFRDLPRGIQMPNGVKVEAGSLVPVGQS